MFNVKQTIYTSLLVAIGIILPITLHAIPNSGMILLPMHIPVLICGLICGPVYGLICGILTPILSSLLTGMPPAAMLPAMICELAVYGALAGIFVRMVRTKNIYVNIYAALIAAMIGGRIVYGILNAFIFKAGEYSMQVWLASAFVTALPGVIIQLVLIPIIVIALQKTRLVEIYS